MHTPRQRDGGCFRAKWAACRNSVPHAVRLSLGGPSSRADLERALDLVSETLDGPADAGFEVV